jgi:hypothetical protein
VVVRVTEAASPAAPVAGAFVDVRHGGALLGVVSCLPQASGSVCVLGGGGGGYDLRVGAPGFRSVERSVEVPGEGGACCPDVRTQQLDVALER